MYKFLLCVVMLCGGHLVAAPLTSMQVYYDYNLPVNQASMELTTEIRYASENLKVLKETISDLHPCYQGFYNKYLYLLKRVYRRERSIENLKVSKGEFMYFNYEIKKWTTFLKK